jgi:hypothetical protein
VGTLNGSTINRRLFIALLLAIGLTFTSYLILGHTASTASAGDFLILPLDDTYIHFQYARMIAQGDPFRYHPNDPATSGATSLIYPFLLAVGYKLGFTGTNLALWAIGIGGVAWFAATWLVYRLINIVDASRPLIAFLIALAFGVSGGLAWAALSGMETALIVCLTLYVLDRAVRGDLRGVVIGGVLCAITRPEGAIVAVLAAGYVVIPLLFPRLKPRAILKVVRQNFESSPVLQRRVHIGWLLGIFAIFLAIAIQPALNYALTGTFTASGMQAKSILYNIPFDLPTAIAAVFNNFGRAWLELLTGLDRDGVIYFAPVLLVIGLIGAVFSRATRRPALLVLLVIAGNFAALSILETAFWQFKRYQQPAIALAFVAFGWYVIRQTKYPKLLFAGFMVIFSVLASGLFAMLYRDNVYEVASLQVPLGRYVHSITTPQDRIAVHDIGVMAYIGERPVYDVVGLATLGVASAWRSGPGAVYEQLRASTSRPTHMAIYEEPHGLSYFKNTPLFMETLRRFPSTNIPRNVASAASGQIVTRIDWSGATVADKPIQPALEGFVLTDQLNIANLDDERAHRYQSAPADLIGYATETFYQPTLNSDAKFLDGGRRVNREQFTIRTTPNQELFWMIRVHPRSTAHLTLYADDQRVGALVQPGDLGGRWLEIAAIIPARYIRNSETRLRVQAEPGEVYQPYQHWFYQSATAYQPEIVPTLPPLHVDFAPGVRLLGARATRNGAELILETEWQALPDAPRTDGKIFVHVYKDPDQPPVAQMDTRAGNGALPPANWLPGIVRERYLLTLPSATDAYQLAIGLYNPQNNQRYPIVSNGQDRLFIEIQ